MDYQEELKNLLDKTIQKKFCTVCKIEITETPEAFGKFYSTPAALVLAKKLKEEPRVIAEKLRVELEKNPPEWLEGIDVSGVYLNFHFDINKILQTLNQKIEFSGFAQGEKIILEHTAVNPNKAMHIGHLRNAVLGDTLARILKNSQANIEIQNYIDDTGLQVVHTTLALLAIQEKWFADAPKPSKNQPQDEWYSKIYVWISQKIKDAKITDKIDLKAKEKEFLYAIEENQGEYAVLAKKVVQEMLEAHLKVLQRLDIEYDLLVRESNLIHLGFWQEAFKKLKKSPKFILEKSGTNKGCWLIKYGDEHEDKILVRADGTLVYTAKDIAYHLWKFGLISDLFKYQKFSQQPSGKNLYTTSEQGKQAVFGKADKIINVIDVSQSYPQKVVKDALKLLGFKKQAENYFHLTYEQVLLSADTAKTLGVKIEAKKNIYAMSGRAGIDIKANHLIDKMSELIKKHKGLRGDARKIACGAVRFYLLSQRANQRLIFDIGNALNTNGKSGIYCIYALARSQGILKKVQSPKSKTQNFKNISNLPAVINLVKTLMEFSGAYAKTSASFDPSFLADYTYNLASAFNNFYEKHPIISEKDPEKRQALIELVKISQKYLELALKLLGIPPEKKI